MPMLAIQDVLSRLYNDGIQSQPSGTFWTPAEITFYIQETLRSWNAYTGFWRDSFTFDIDTVANNGSNWYDLTQQIDTLRPYTVTDQYIVNEIELQLLEPQTSFTPTSGTPAVWTGSNQFALQDILDAITRRQNEVLTQTGCTVSQSFANAVIGRRTLLPDTTLDIRRVAWIPQSGFGYIPMVMRQSDVWAKQSFDVTWTQASQKPPRNWMQSADPPPAFDVDYIPPCPGKYDVLTVSSGPTSNATSAQLMAIPDDWTFVAKWGALADLLSREANAKDPTRAQYCQQRFLMDCKILRDAPSILGMQLNGIPIFCDAVKNGDDFNPGWQAQTPAIPRSAYTSGLNMVAFPNPDQIYNVLANVIINAPVPFDPTDQIQISRGDYDAMIDECFHIAMWKVGGLPFLNTIPLHQRFLDQAALYNSKLRTYGQFPMDMREISHRENKRNPILTTA